jgi:hypothetical protein
MPYLTIGDVIHLKSFKCYFPDDPSSKVQLEWVSFTPSTKKHKFAAIFMGEQVDDNPIDPEKFLNVLGWERKPVNATTKYKVGMTLAMAGREHDTLEDAQKDLEAIERLTARDQPGGSPAGYKIFKVTVEEIEP